jgi:ferredoxin
MKKARIYLFSGTGNTDLVARAAAAELARLGCDTELLRIEDVLKSGAGVEVEGLDLVGVACPVIGFGVPLVVRRFLRAFPRAKGMKAFIIRTAGGVSPVNHNASRPIRRRLTRLGYDVFHERLFSVGSNWIVRFGNDVVRSLVGATGEKVALMCSALLAGERRVLPTTAWRRLRMGAVRLVSSLGLRFMALDLRVTGACTACGLCQRGCPSGNIRDKGGRISFGAACSSCLRCVYSCPRAAIEFRMLRFFPVKGGYNLRKILESPADCPDGGAKKDPAFLPAYLADPTR